MNDMTVYLIELDGKLLSKIHYTPEEVEIGVHTLFETVSGAKEANIIMAKLHDLKTTYINKRKPSKPCQ